MDKAREWIRTDPEAIRSDIERLGTKGAVEYQMSLMADSMHSGDARWVGITADDMRAAIAEIVKER